MKIQFFGAAKQVTGSKHLVKLENGKQILLDCGLFQGRFSRVGEWNANFGFSPREVDYLVLSHAHIDHSGLIPKLVKEGFKGPIFCTPATLDLCRIMLVDSAGIQEEDVRYVNRIREAKGQKLVEPLYTIQDAIKCLEQFVKVPYDRWIDLDEEVKLQFTDAGHILGSAVVNLKLKDGMQHHRLAFTGDIGRFSNRILKQPQPFPQCDYLICESTYGNRIHNKPPDTKKKLKEIVYKAIVEKRGKLLIPAFSVGRTQEIVSILNDLHFEGELPKVQVFVDSPMAVSATEVMKAHPECYNDRMRKFMEEDPDPFGFQGLHYIRDVRDSKKLNEYKEPCIIISASGMIEGGRIKHHLVHNIEKPSTTILIVGYCSKSSVGGQLVNGADEVKLFGDYFKVKAEVERINEFSAHGDYEEMMKLLECQEKHIVKRTFLVHGDEEVMEEWQETLYKNGYHNIVIPDFKSEHEL